MTLFKRPAALLALLLPLSAPGAVMKVGDLRVQDKGWVTNSLTASNLIDRYNIKWWGADPTGVADSTTAIQNTIDFVGAGRVYVPQGSYLISSLRITNDFVTISGDGPGASAFLSTSVLPMFVLSGSAPVIENLNLQGNNKATFGLYLTNSAEQGIFRNIVIDQINGTGILARTNSFSLLFDRARVIRCSTGINLVSGFQNSRFDHCLFYYNTNYQMIAGIVGRTNVGLSIHDSDLEGIVTSTNLLINDVAAVVVDSSYFECGAATSKDIVVDGTGSIVGINGMYSNGMGVSTNSIFVVGTGNSVTLSDSFIFNFTTAPVVSSDRLSINNCLLNTVYYPMKVSVGSLGTNTALHTTVAPAALHSITVGKGWTNDLGARADMVLLVKYIGTATTGPGLAFTNSATGETWTNSIAQALAFTNILRTVVPDISTNDYGSFTDVSGASSSVTFLNAWWKLK